jgi:hypothetical protein
MNWSDWYTDLMEIRRTETVKDGQLSRKERKVVCTGVPCRVYRSQDKPLTMTQTAANVQKTDKLACDIDVDIKPGDELVIHRGARLGHDVQETRYFAGEPDLYYEPFGAVLPGLAHQEVVLLSQERVK